MEERMPIKIGDKTLSTSRPKDLDAAVADTGLSGEEVRRGLGGGMAYQVAQALRPWLGNDAPSVPELASLIAVAGLEDVRRQVIGLYGEPEPKARASGE
jgi:hypothetical protein